MRSFALLPTFLFIQTFVSAAPPTAVTKQPFTTLTAPPISTSIGGETIKFVEGTNDNGDKTRFKFPQVSVSGVATLILHSDGRYENDGMLNHNGPSDKTYNVAFWWKVIDAAGRKYYFGSDGPGGTGCGPARKLKFMGDNCDWHENMQKDKIKSNWADLQKAKATAFPVVFPN